jgi:hypothetical protein
MFRLAGLSGLTEKRITFSAADAVIEVAAWSQQGATVEQLVTRSAHDELLTRPEIFRIVDDGLTPRDLVECQGRAIEACTARRSEDCADRSRPGCEVMRNAWPADLTAIRSRP